MKRLDFQKAHRHKVKEKEAEGEREREPSKNQSNSERCFTREVSLSLCRS